MMIRLVLLISLITLSIESISQSDSEVYKGVIKEYVLKARQSKTAGLDPKTMVVLQKPSHQINADYVFLRTKYRKLERQTVDDFVNKNENEVMLHSLDMKPLRIVTIKNPGPFLSSNDLNVIRGDLRRHYPDFTGEIFEFSNVGFNEKATQALLYFGYTNGPTGGGLFIIYKKKRTRWKKVKQVGAWAS